MTKKKITLDDIQMEIIQIREAIDMQQEALKAFGEKGNEGMIAQIKKLQVQEDLLNARLKEWTL